MAALTNGDRWEQRIVAAVTPHDAAAGVPWTAGGGAAFVDAIHRLRDEGVGKMAGVGDRPVVAAGTGMAFAGLRAQSRGVPAIFVGTGGGIGLVREGEQLQQMIVVDLPIQLRAPEVVAAVGVPGLHRIDVARIAFLLFVHREEEQPVADDGAGRPYVGLVEGRAVAAPAVAFVDRPVRMELVLAIPRPGP